VVDLVQVGAYQPGVSPETDKAIALYPEVCRFLQQDLGSHAQLEQSTSWMNRLAQQWHAPVLAER
jgi:flagellum-specific ATP synthase